MKLCVYWRTSLVKGVNICTLHNSLHKGLLVKIEGAAELARWMLANADGI